MAMRIIAILGRNQRFQSVLESLMPLVPATVRIPHFRQEHRPLVTLPVSVHQMLVHLPAKESDPIRRCRRGSLGGYAAAWPDR